MKIKLLAACLLSCLTIAACSQSDTTKQQETQTIAASSTHVANTATAEAVNHNPDWPSYLATTDATNAPYELHDTKGGIIGFDADLIQAIAKQEQFNVQIISQPWDGIFKSLNSNQNHILIAPLTITPERSEQVTFTIPYIYPTRTAYLLPETAERLGIRDYADLPKASSIAAKGKTTNVSSLEADFGAENLKIKGMDSQYLAFADMIRKQSDVAFGDTAVLQYHATSVKDTNFVKIEQPLKIPVEAGFAVKKGNTELAAKLNSGLKKVVVNGEYRRIAIKWFGEDLGNKIANTTEAHMKIK
ncbi:MAG: transporter substrate-binding domain-containing protein [Alysiella sp.]|uniref:substrate-binding periplasmic protein n=1 Tax=Alysiella sp. TaxID=1872483 RepID=UPI0026DC77BC|nr:transporter substrate-binding domain-containing protein [Alysiella sp.]MDO4434686.1 transporter substrate-binding domain-containing protein [Alysiella sp.]